MSMNISASALNSLLAAQQQNGQTAGGDAPAKGMFDDIMSSLQTTVEPSQFAGLAAYGQGQTPGTGGFLASPWEQFPGQPLSNESLAAMAREMKIQSDIRSVTSTALHKVLDGIQDTARTLTRQG